MKKALFYLLALSVLGAVAMLVTGCASSTPSRFYQLSSVQNGVLDSPGMPPKDRVIVIVGPVRIPEYLDRPQIVTQSGTNELNISDFDRWAGPIDNNILNVLSEDVASQLPRDRFFVVPWTPFMESQVPAAYRIGMVISHFEGVLGGSVTLRVQWGISFPGSGMLLNQETAVVEQANGSGYNALVSAMSRALEKLSLQMAEQMKTAIEMKESAEALR